MSARRPRPWPTAIRVRKSAKTVEVDFDSGEAFAIRAENLRVHSPSAEVKGHGPGQGVLVLGKQDVTVVAAEPVGNYAVRLVFDDGHATGLFTWDTLYELGRDQDALMAAYAEKVRAAS